MITTVAPGASGGVPRPRRDRAGEGRDLRGARARRRGDPARDIATYPILLAAARRRAGARPVRFGATGRPEYRLLEDAVSATTATCAAARRMADACPATSSRAPGRHLAMNALGVLAAVEALGGDIARAALALANWRRPRGAARAGGSGSGGRDRRLDADRRSYNANPAAMAAAFEVLAATPPEDGVGRVGARAGGSPFSATCSSSGRRARAARRPRARPALAAVSTVHCAGPRMRALHDALPGRRSAASGSQTRPPWRRARGRLLDAGRRGAGQGIERQPGQPGR